MDSVARNPGSTVCIDVRNVVVMLAVNPGLATVGGAVNAVAVVVFSVLGHVASGVLAEGRNDDVVLVGRVDGHAAIRTLVLFVALGGAAFVFYGITRGQVGPSATCNIVLIETAAGNIVRAWAIGKGHVHVAVYDFGTVGHQARGNSLDGFPGGTAVVAHLQVVLGFRSTDVDCCGASVGELALSRVEHHKTDAVHAVQAAFGCGRKGNLVKTGPCLTIVGTLVHALGAAAAKNNIALVWVYSQFFAGLTAHAVAVSKHFDVACIPSSAKIFTTEDCRTSLAKIACSCEYIDAFGVVWVERKGFGTVKTHVVLVNPVHQRNPVLFLEIKTINTAYVGTCVEHVFCGGVENDCGYESAAVKTDVAPSVFFCICRGREHSHAQCNRQNFHFSKHAISIFRQFCHIRA